MHEMQGMKVKVGYNRAIVPPVNAPPHRPPRSSANSTCSREMPFSTSQFITIYFNLESEGLFSKSLSLRRWEVLCHPSGMCNSSIPPTLLHPGAGKPLGIPSSLIKHRAGGLLQPYHAFLFARKIILRCFL